MSTLVRSRRSRVRSSSPPTPRCIDIGKPTGVFASEMTVPYYAFVDAGMDVDVASPLGGVIPVDPQSLKPVVRCADDDRFLADDGSGPRSPTRSRSAIST